MRAGSIKTVTRGLAGFIGACVLVSMVWAPAPAEAQGRPLLVVPFERDNIDDIFFQTLMKRARESASGSKDFVALDPVESDLSELLFSVGCDEATVDCLQLVAESFTAEVVLYGKVWGNDRGIYLEVHLFDAQLGSELLDEPIQRSFESKEKEMLLKMAVGELQQIFYPFTGELTIASSEPATTILFDGAEVGNTSIGPVKLTALKLGEHTVTARKGGDEVTRIIVVMYNDPLSLTLDPAEGGDGPGTGGGEGFAHTGSFIAFGVGGASLILGGVFGAIVNGQNGEVEDLAGLDPVDSGPANDVLDSGPTNELLQFVFYGVGAVAVGAGVFLYIMEGNEEAEKTSGTTISPILTGDGIGAAIGGSF